MKAKHVSFGSEGWDSPPPDNANLRLWEVAGASHVSVDEMMPYMNEQILRNGSFRYNGGPPSDVMPALAGCGSQPVLSRIPNGDVVSAGIAALVRWVRDGKAPPTGPRMMRDTAGKLIRDADGRVTGGIRLAAYDAPMSKSVGFNTGGPNCTVMGSHIDFTPAEMCRRYGSPQGYVTKVTEVTRKAQRDGFVLKSDADRTIADAAGLKFSCR
jgi:hypothetical protein